MSGPPVVICHRPKVERKGGGSLEDTRQPGGDWDEQDDRAIEESLWRSAQGYDVEETVE